MKALKRQFIFLEPLKNVAMPKDAKQSLKDLYDVCKKNKVKKEDLLLLEGLYKTYTVSNNVVSIYLVAAEYALSKSKEDSKISKYYTEIIDELSSFSSEPEKLVLKLLTRLESLRNQHSETRSQLSFEDSDTLSLGVSYLSNYVDNLVTKYSTIDDLLNDKICALDLECPTLDALIGEVKISIRCMGGDPDTHFMNTILYLKYKNLNKNKISLGLLKPFIQELITKEISITKIESYSSDIGSKGGRPTHPHKHEALSNAKQKWEQIPSASVSVISTTVKSILEKKYTGAPKIAAIKKWLQDADFRPK